LKPQTLALEVGCGVDWSRRVILIQSPLKGRAVRSSRCAEFVLVEVGIIEIIVVQILLLAPDTPGSIGQSGKKQSTTDTTNDTTDCFLGCVTESRTSTAATAVCQRRGIDTCGDGNGAAACAGDMNSTSSFDTCNGCDDF